MRARPPWDPLAIAQRQASSASPQRVRGGASERVPHGALHRRVQGLQKARCPQPSRHGCPHRYSAMAGGRHRADGAGRLRSITTASRCIGPQHHSGRLHDPGRHSHDQANLDCCGLSGCSSASGAARCDPHGAGTTTDKRPQHSGAPGQARPRSRVAGHAGNPCARAPNSLRVRGRNARSDPCGWVRHA